jgi:hypothetical protein
MIAQISRAVLLAIATVATLVGFRASRSARRGSILPGEQGRSRCARLRRGLTREACRQLTGASGTQCRARGSSFYFVYLRSQESEPLGANVDPLGLGGLRKVLLHVGTAVVEPTDGHT